MITIVKHSLRFYFDPKRKMEREIKRERRKRVNSSINK